MDINTAFSLEILKQVRRDAKAYQVAVPKSLTALRSGIRDQWFVQGKDDQGDYVSADNAYEARANYIQKLINKAHPQLEEETQTCSICGNEGKLTAGVCSACTEAQKEHAGAVCSECGKTVTEGEYSIGESLCCIEDVIPAEDFGKGGN